MYTKMSLTALQLFSGTPVSREKDSQRTNLHCPIYLGLYEITGKSQDPVRDLQPARTPQLSPSQIPDPQTL